jgi:hypothetical protein
LPEGTFAIRTGEELRHTQAKLTGVSPEQGAATGSLYPGSDTESQDAVNIAGVYSRVRPLLATTNDLQGLSEFKQFANLKLAAAFCHQVACNPSPPAYLPRIDQGAELAFGVEGNRLDFAQKLLEQLWGPADQGTLPPRATAASDVAEYLSELYLARTQLKKCTNTALSVNATTANLEQARSIAKAACTLVLGSLPVQKF